MKNNPFVTNNQPDYEVEAKTEYLLTNVGYKKGQVKSKSRALEIDHKREELELKKLIASFDL